jgi:hypothetical protein
LREQVKFLHILAGKRKMWRRRLDDAAVNANLFQMNHTGDIIVEKYWFWK